MPRISTIFREISMLRGDLNLSLWKSGGQRRTVARAAPEAKVTNPSSPRPLCARLGRSARVGGTCREGDGPSYPVYAI